jgi:hypothetical protein
MCNAQLFLRLQRLNQGVTLTVGQYRKWMSHNTIVFGIYFILGWRHVSAYLSGHLQVIIYMSLEEDIQRKFFFGGTTARGGPWPPLQYAFKPLDPTLCLSIRLFPSFSGPWTRHPAISFLVFLFVLLHTAFRTSFLELQCLTFFLYDQAIVFFGI